MTRTAELIPLDRRSAIASGRVRELLAPDAVGLLALRHALEHGVPGLWGDDAISPHCLLLAREGYGEVEIFGVGAPEPAVEWLASLSGRVALTAPMDWHEAVEARTGACERGTVVTCVQRSAETVLPALPRGVRPLELSDAGAFAATAPVWALSGWRTFGALIAHGAVFGIPHNSGFAALAWVFDATDRFDALAVYTAPKFRRLGLGRAVCLTLLAHVREVRGRTPLWSVSAANTASLALARTLGFAPRVTETVLRWPARGR